MNIQTCFSTDLFHLYEHSNKTVVIIDIMRATSAICSAFEHGVKKIIPVSTVAEAEMYKQKGFLTAGERDGIKLPQFDFGNSPFDFQTETTLNKEVVLTTTNGTKACNMSLGAKNILIGSFINLNAVAEKCVLLQNEVILLCSGWKGRFNIEDSLFAGALSSLLISKFNYTSDCDSTKAVQVLYKQAENNLVNYMYLNSFRINMRKEELFNDIQYCFSLNKSTKVPYLYNNEIIV